MQNNKNIRLSGIVKRHPDGFGFFIPDDRSHPDAYVTKPEMKGLMSNDQVEARLFPEPGGKRFRAKITRVNRRASQNIIGQVHILKGGQPFLVDTSLTWGGDLKLTVDPSTQKVEDGTWVVAEVTHYPDHPDGFQGRVAQVLGEGLKASQDNLRVLFAHSIPQDFSKACLGAAKKLSKKTISSELKNRKDLRKTPFITIDGATAKDFDDAIFVEKTGKGFTLFVAIADVSFYVPEGEAIDKDAYERGTSTYLPNYVNPMLPEELSNELCSLMPKVDRLAMVAEMNFDHSGQMQETNFYEAVIKSHARVTYGEAQEIIEGERGTKHKSVEKHILMAMDLAKVLMKVRSRKGSLDLEVPETNVQVNEAGEVVDISQSQRLFAHRLIEEMMLAANVAVANFLIDKKVPGMFRVHEPPKPEMIDKLEVYLDSLGVSENLSGGNQQKKITKALKKFEGKPEHKILSMLTLRSMNQAKYSFHNVGHFGLGFRNYSHFTSPIRRYPDLVVHRQIKSYINTSKSYSALDDEGIESKSTWLSACEQRSVKAERQVISIKKARFMRQFLGQEFTGYINGLAKFGAFVAIREYDVDGLVKIEKFPGDRYDYIEEQMCLVGKKSGFEFKVGDEVKIQVVAVNEEDGKIDFDLVFDQELKSQIQGQKRKSGSKEKSKSKKPKSKSKTKAKSKAKSKSRHRKKKDSGKKKTKDEEKSSSGKKKKKSSKKSLSVIGILKGIKSSHKRTNKKTAGKPKRKKK